MPHSTYVRDQLGLAVLTPGDSVVAGSFASLALCYTAGPFGVDDTGNLRIVHRYATDMGKPQFDDPTAPNYTTVEASNGAVLDYGFDVKRNIRPWGKTLHIKLVRGFLQPGDRIVVRYGDRRGGGPGMRMQTFCEHAFEFRVLVDPWATYDFAELPESPTLAIVPGPPVRWRAVLPTLRRCGEPFRLSLKAEDRWGNPSDHIDATIRLRPSMPVAGLPETVSFRPGQSAAVMEDLSVDTEADLVVDVFDGSGGLLTRSNPLRVVQSAALVSFWGDLHGQSAETIGTNSAEDYLTFGRDRAFLDVISHQGNDFQITGAFWAHLQTLTARYDEPGRFVTLPGYEWSGNTALGGDHNVLFRREGRQIRRSSHALIPDLSDVETDCHTTRDLFRALREDGADDVVVFAHVGGRYADLDAVPDDERLIGSVEIHSAWGTFEWLLNDAIERGYRVGVVANSDGHKGRPGASYPGTSLFGSYGGLTCLLCEALTRDDVFDCLRRRHHYATTGARVLLDVRISPGSRTADEATMGDIIRMPGPSVRMHVTVLGTAPIERIEIRNGLETLDVIRPYDRGELGRRIRVVWEGAEYRGRGRQTAWDGRAWLDGNAFERVAAINFHNPDRPIELHGQDTLSWEALTTGNFCGFDAWLRDRDAGTLLIDTPLVGQKVAIAEIGFEDVVFEAGGLDRRIRAFRLPDENTHCDVRIDRDIPLKATGDNPLYVCVTQEDGHRAWSSPVYVHR